MKSTPNSDLELAREPWVGVAHVKPRAGNEMLDGAAGAFVPTVAIALDENDFTAKVVAKLNSFEFDVNEITDIEPCRKRFQRGVHPHLRALAASLNEEKSVLFDEFQAYQAG